MLMVLLSGCTSVSLNTIDPQTENTTSSTDKIAALIAAEKVGFKSGTSSITVEKLAIQQQCMPLVGARLDTDEGPLEYYRVKCSDGRELAAYCELRQCGLFPVKLPAKKIGTAPELRETAAIGSELGLRINSITNPVPLVLNNYYGILGGLSGAAIGKVHSNLAEVLGAGVGGGVGGLISALVYRGESERIAEFVIKQKMHFGDMVKQEFVAQLRKDPATLASINNKMPNNILFRIAYGYHVPLGEFSLKPYIVVSARLTDITGMSVWDDREIVTGLNDRASDSFNDYIGSAAQFKSEFRSVTHDVVEQLIANYKKKNGESSPDINRDYYQQ